MLSLFQGTPETTSVNGASAYKYRYYYSVSKTEYSLVFFYLKKKSILLMFYLF